MKLPPQAIEVEQAVLGAILHDPEAMDRVVDTIITPDVFYKKHHQYIWLALAHLYENNIDIEIIAVCDRLGKQNQLTEIGGRTTIIELAESVATAAHIEHHASLLIEKYQQRRILAAADQIRQLIDEQEEEFADKASEIMYAACQLEKATSDLWTQVGETMQKNADVLAGTGSLGKLWRIPQLDTYAPIMAGEMTLLAAEEKAGKSKVMVRIISEALDLKLGVLFFTLEMRPGKVLNWLASYRERIDSVKFRDATLTAEEEQRANLQLSKIAEQDKLIICDKSFPTIGYLVNRIRREKRLKNIGLVVVDYFQRVDVGKEKGQNFADAQEQFMLRLANAGRDYNVAIVMATQMIKSAQGERVQRSGMIKGSGAQSQAADQIIFMRNHSLNKAPGPYNRPGDQGVKVTFYLDRQRDGVSSYYVETMADLRFGSFQEERSGL